VYNLDEIITFLYLGYLTNYNEDFKSSILPENDLSDWKPELSYQEENELTLVEKGIQALKTCFENIEEGQHIIPLSGGLDSRTILANLIDRGLRDKIITITWGYPGTWNFELGSHLAKKIGVRHETFDLRKVPVDQDSLLEIAKNGSAWTFIIDAFYNSLIPKKFGKGPIYWSGFMGDVLTGQDFPPEELTTWSETVKWYVNQARFIGSIRLTPPEYKPEESFPTSPLIDRSILNYLDLIRITFRQQNYTKRVLTFKDYDYRTPFLSSQWVNFTLSIPFRYRVNQYLYKKILLEAYPDFFLLPTTNHIGASLDATPMEITTRRVIHGIRKKIDNIPFFDSHFMDPAWNLLKIYRKDNYVDFDEAIRKRDDFKDLVYSNLQDLKNRKILHWLDIDRIWSRHQKRIANYGDGLMHLTALEISLKVTLDNNSK